MEGANSNNKIRIGLALSGGGFRASFFHLGVIRRLEELGIMKNIEVISTVSGGSILGAYYLCQMEKERRSGLYDNDRVAMCDAIIEKFYNAVRTNMRMRAITFAPFFHPVLFFFKSLLGSSNRAVRMAQQFKRNFFSPDLRLDDLPSSPEILINTTSNSTGKRVVFFKDEMNTFSSQISKVEYNKLPLAKVVGASAAVPGVFPPVPIASDLFSDGGVVDNQGLESLFDYFYFTKDNTLDRVSVKSPIEKGDRIVIVCSDASGQIEVQDMPKKTGIASAIRSTSILQATNRNKVLKLLKQYCDDNDCALTEFAFVHLSKNLKNWEGQKVGDKKYQKIKERLRSEFITPVSLIRTDLDEFDLIESLSLMYHGYTLINWQIDAYCPGLRNNYNLRINEFDGWTPSFLTEENLTGSDKTVTGNKQGLPPEKKRGFIAKRLAIGSQLVFRNIRKEKKSFIPLLIVSFLPMLLILWSPFRKFLFCQTGVNSSNLGTFIAENIIRKISHFIPKLWPLFETNGRYGDIPIFFSDLIVTSLLIYLSLFLYWRLNRSLVSRLYKRDFVKVSPAGSKIPFS